MRAEEDTNTLDSKGISFASPVLRNSLSQFNKKTKRFDFAEVLKSCLDEPSGRGWMCKKIIRVW